MILKTTCWIINHAVKNRNSFWWSWGTCCKNVEIYSWNHFSQFEITYFLKLIVIPIEPSLRGFGDADSTRSGSSGTSTSKFLALDLSSSANLLIFSVKSRMAFWCIIMSILANWTLRLFKTFSYWDLRSGEFFFTSTYLMWSNFCSLDSLVLKMSTKSPENKHDWRLQS